MTKQEKGAVIDELVEKFSNTNYFYITDASGMDVAKTNNLRRLAFERGVEYKVFKNTLIKKALDRQEVDYSALDAALVGFSGIMFHPESGKVPAKLIKDFLKENKDAIKLKGASVDQSVFVGHNQLDTLLNLKSKQELVGDIIGLLQSPAKNVISGLSSGGNKLAGILKTLSEREG
jgi:large subunit ribosomal protein L10